ncbi:hypothetical protein ABG067_003832 [Albugo candida]
MRASPMKAYALLGIGLFLMHHQLVASSRGLLVLIDPELRFSDDTKFSDSVHDNVMYTLSVETPCSTQDSTHAVEQDLLKDAWTAAKSVVNRYWSYPCNSISQTYPSMSNNFSVPLLQDPTPIPTTIGGNVYTIGWRLAGTSLKYWINSKMLYADKGKLYTSVQTYLTQNQGLYFLTWTKTENYRINYGHEKVSEASGVCLLKGYFKANVHLFGETHTDQEIRIDFDVEAIKIPGSIFRVMENQLQSMTLEISKIEDKVVTLRFIENENDKSTDKINTYYPLQF